MTRRGVDVGLFHQAQAWLKIRLFSQHVCSFEDVIIFYSKEICKAQWLSWLERRPVTAEVESSSLFWVVTA